MQNKFDSVVLGALEVAQAEALKQYHPELDAYHLLWGLLTNKASFSSRGLKSYKKLVEQKLKALPKSSQKLGLDQIKTSAKLSEWLTMASSHVIQNGNGEVTEKDLLRFITQIFPEIEFKEDDFKNNDTEDEEFPAFLVNLNELAGRGKLDPVIGRSKEIRAVMEILGRRGKNNPVLIGPAGVGKTAIVEGLADSIVKGQVPDVLLDKEIYSLDMGQLMAGTKFRGEFEERLQTLLKFMKGKAGQVILFIDEIHQLVGAGKTEGAMDAANLLKPALARGELHCVGATTPEEYQKYILGDSALDRRFRPVPVNEPSKEDSIEILMGLREKLEIHHGIKISDDSLYQAVFLSAQYITDKNLPDKAIDLVDEAASSLKLSTETMPPKLVELEAEIRSKSIQAQVEKDNKEITQEVEKLKARLDEEKKKWEEQVLSVKRVSELKNDLDRLKFQLEQAQREQNYEEASVIKYSKIPEIEAKLLECGHDFELTSKDVAQVISRQTGIPLEKIMRSRQDHILKLEGFLNSRVFGQKEPLTEISETLISSHAGLSDPSRPLGSFLLLGPSGVGKTETAKSIAEFLFNDENSMIRLDMSEFSEKHSVAKLIGAPAGYVGYEAGGILTEAVRKKPYAVILFDEIEKAHTDFADILLQILDDGRLTDSKGRTIDFKNTIIMLTSNSKNPESEFKPEVLGRLDARLDYHELDKGIMEKLVSKELALLNQRLQAKKLNVELSSELFKELCERGYDSRYGARPLKSVFQKLVTRPLGKKVLADELPEGKVRAIYHNENAVTQFEAIK